MIHIKNLKQDISIFKALSSSVRIDILNILSEYKQLNMNELADKLNLTNGAVTTHVKKLEECGLITTTNITGRHGVQKICSIHENKILIDLEPQSPENSYDVNLSIGHYSSYDITPTCGLASKDKIIGEVDNPNYFADPERISADILWFTKGFIEYRVPNYLKINQTFSELQFSMEICSEAPGICNNWPSDIHFSINNIEIGIWTSPGDFGDNKGLLTPSWWFPNWNQYGLLKLISINNYGTFIDGLKISNITLNDLNLTYKSDIIFRLSVPETTKYSGGLTLFGNNFGNYNQGIQVRIIYNE
ncbi:MAG TPA: transcriptional regulator [Clostridium sp.]|nr:transcriptional regulator [Clostridium sp.]